LLGKSISGKNSQGDILAFSPEIIKSSLTKTSTISPNPPKEKGLNKSFQLNDFDNEAISMYEKLDALCKTISKDELLKQKASFFVFILKTHLMHFF